MGSSGDCGNLSIEFPLLDGLGTTTEDFKAHSDSVFV